MFDVGPASLPVRCRLRHRHETCACTRARKHLCRCICNRPSCGPCRVRSSAPSASRSVAATASASPGAVLRARPEEPAQPVALRARHDVHVEVGHALADDVVLGDERALRAERRRDRRGDDAARARTADRRSAGAARAASRRGDAGRPARGRGTAACGRGTPAATSSSSTTSAGGVAGDDRAERAARPRRPILAAAWHPPSAARTLGYNVTPLGYPHEHSSPPIPEGVAVTDLLPVSRCWRCHGTAVLALGCPDPDRPRHVRPDRRSRRASPRSTTSTSSSR